ncbi:MAG: hypothetical protein H0W02_15470 [Ktedonobacteraceae bacterium]|nr:hypothetical protein [Ktedonobacteraceae bacterium]
MQYQQGELLGYEVRAFLLEKWGRTCAYCDAQNVPLEHRSCHMQQRLDGYSYRVGARLSPLLPSPKGAPVSPCA